jgi:hypothetical protein
VRIAAQSAEPTEKPWGCIAHQKGTPEADLGGKRKAVFWGYAGSAKLGKPFEVSQRLTLGLLDFGGALCGSLARLCANALVWAYMVHKQKTPEADLGGKRRGRFCGGMPGQGRLGSPFQASQPMTLGLSGFGGESIRYQPMVGWKKTGTPCDVRAWSTVLSRSGRLVQAQGDHFIARSISSSSPKYPALPSAFAKTVHPSDQWTRHSAYPRLA